MKTPIFFLFFAMISCSASTNEQHTSLINTAGRTIEDRVKPPEGFERMAANSSTFESYLRHLPLKPYGSPVLLFNGKKKGNQKAHVSVIDLPIGSKNLHQCADGVIRLRADYLWKQQQFEQIQFNFTNGWTAQYTEWMKGKRIRVNGNNISWEPTTAPSNSLTDFWEYLETVFTYAGTISLSNELKTIPVEEMKIGDVFIQAGSPGHAVIVVDMAINIKTNEKIFLLAQSYMPAQEMHLLQNPADTRLSPWYSTTKISTLVTPEWRFTKNDLKRF